MGLKIKTVSSERLSDRGTAANALVAAINGTEYGLPSLCANNPDYDKATKTNTKIESNMFNYHVAKGGAKTNSKTHILEDFVHKERAHRPTVTSMSFDRRLTQSDLSTKEMLQLQKDANTTFVSCPESDLKQGVAGLKRDLEVLESFDTDQVRCPTIDTKCPLLQFKQKVDYIANEEHYGRFNVNWGGYSDTEKWIALSKALYERKKWCNMTGLYPRRTRPSRSNPGTTSTVAQGLLYGLHTFCFSWPPMGNNEAWLFDGTNWRYKKTTTYDHEEATIRSFNAIQGELLAAHEQIRASTFSEYCYNKEGLRAIALKTVQTND